MTTWIQTYSGEYFTPLCPNQKAINLIDIAHSLSLQCRFNGHCRKFYSVAEHCVRVARILPNHLHLWGLLHDAAEAYISDVPSPIKAILPELIKTEEILLEQIAIKFNLEWPMPPEILEADLTLLATEARDLMLPPPASWDLPYEPLSEPLGDLLSPREAEISFIRAYHGVFMGRKLS